jgi:hypothetical protein
MDAELPGGDAIPFCVAHEQIAADVRLGGQFFPVISFEYENVLPN